MAATDVNSAHTGPAGGVPEQVPEQVDKLRTFLLG